MAYSVKKLTHESEIFSRPDCQDFRKWSLVCALHFPLKKKEDL